MTIYSFPKTVALVREKNVKLHFSSCKIIVTQMGRMCLVGPVFGTGLWGSFSENKNDGTFGRFKPNKTFHELCREDVDKAKLMIKELSMVEERGLTAIKEISILTGNCCVCGRVLTNESSIEDGIGPICSGKVGEMW